METIFVPIVDEKYNFRVTAVCENVTIVSKSTLFIAPQLYHGEREIYFITSLELIQYGSQFSKRNCRKGHHYYS
jgi:hypothetical protein